MEILYEKQNWKDSFLATCPPSMPRQNHKRIIDANLISWTNKKLHTHWQTEWLFPCPTKNNLLTSDSIKIKVITVHTLNENFWERTDDFINSFWNCLNFSSRLQLHKTHKDFLKVHVIYKYPCNFTRYLKHFPSELHTRKLISSKVWPQASNYKWSQFCQ